MASRKIYQILGLVAGFVLIDYGFNIIAVGFRGAREFTSQFLGANLLIGGSLAIFLSLYYLLKPSTPQALAPAPAAGGMPDVGVELVVTEEVPSQVGLYKSVEYIGYFFTALGLFSAADLVLQVFIPAIYSEIRWWVEILLVTFGVLAYAIFGSIGRIGSQEERGYKMPSATAKPTPAQPEPAATVPTQAISPQLSLPQTLDLRVSEFTRVATGDFERLLGGRVYDVFRVDPEKVTIWREERQGIRSLYLAGPYELNKKLLEQQISAGQSLAIGHLSINVDTLKELLGMLEGKPERALQPTS